MIYNIIEVPYPSVLSTDTLTEIERWLSAHLCCVRWTQSAREKIGDGETEYMYKVDLGLKLTTYGQQVLLMDTTGAFAEMQADAEKPKTTVGISWLGTAGDDD
jgi:hypothetical protein